MKDRRYYSRLALNLKCVVYGKGQEFIGEISNLSESGACIILDNVSASEINVGDVFAVQAIDRYSLGSDTYETLVNFSFQVLRVTFTKRGLAIAGVIIAKNYDFLKYIETRKVSSLLEYLGNNKSV